MATSRTPGNRTTSPRFIAPMEAGRTRTLPEGPGWQYEPKWDGFRCIAVREAGRTALFAKSGKPLGRYFPEIVALVEGLEDRRFVLDGELVLPRGATLQFDALQMRLHPAASRIRKLSVETPALYVVFDLLRRGREDLREAPLRERRAALEAFVGAVCGAGAKRGFHPAKLAAARAGPALRLSAATRRPAEAREWLAKSGGALDGIIAKPLDGPYRSGERAMLKFKPLRTADCVVGGFRYASARREVGSLLLGLYDDEGKLHHVGFTSSLPAGERPALTRRLEALRAPPGFTGNAPGAPSRWSTERSSAWEPLKPRLVVEVSYDHVTGDRFRHGTKLLRWRPDKAPRQCTFDQLGP